MCLACAHTPELPHGYLLMWLVSYNKNIKIICENILDKHSVTCLFQYRESLSDGQYHYYTCGYTLF